MQFAGPLPMALRANVRGRNRVVSKAMARRLRVRGIDVVDTAAPSTVSVKMPGTTDATLAEQLAAREVAANSRPAIAAWKASHEVAPAAHAQQFDEASFQRAAAELHAEHRAATDSAVAGHAAQGDPASGADMGSPKTPAAADLADVVSAREADAIAAVVASGDPALCVLPGGEIVSEDALVKRMAESATWGIVFEGSSNIRSASLDQATGIVAVLFKNGQTARYSNFTRELMTEWNQADSAGRWFHQNVRTKPDRHPLVKDEARD